MDKKKNFCYLVKKDPKSLLGDALILGDEPMTHDLPMLNSTGVEVKVKKPNNSKKD
jgi:hypothetical protein